MSPDFATVERMVEEVARYLASAPMKDQINTRKNPVTKKQNRAVTIMDRTEAREIVGIILKELS